jgi:hypothetical protein
MKLRWLVPLEVIMAEMVLTGEILTEEELLKRLWQLVAANLVMMFQHKPDGRWYVWLTPPAVIMEQYRSRKGNVPEGLMEVVANLYEEPNEENAKAVREWFKRTLGYVPSRVIAAIKLLLDGDKWGVAWFKEDLERIEKSSQPNAGNVFIVMEDGQLEKYEIAAVVDADCWEIKSMWIKMKRG